ncbi:hypothetical protein [Burkholderia sp. Nafp2/4-1b]|uniref:hypothetical protein n=1 Tax=Burkholderia sp. Nafp2/4-1b TaxID=2116686 RepID=UPI0013CF08F3|nr:hypothetical protein [Burkholderia sp. Nafp2/4-1b]
MSNLAGMMRRLFANTARVPMDNCPGIRWASWIAPVAYVAHASESPRTKRLGYETSGASGRPSCVRQMSSRRTSCHRPEADGTPTPLRRGLPALRRSKHAAAFNPALRYIAEAFHPSGACVAVERDRARRMDAALDFPCKPVSAGPDDRCRAPRQSCSTIGSRRWYENCIRIAVTAAPPIGADMNPDRARPTDTPG